MARQHYIKLINGSSKKDTCPDCQGTPERGSVFCKYCIERIAEYNKPILEAINKTDQEVEHGIKAGEI